MCHIIGNPLHPDNLDAIDYYDNDEDIGLLEEAMEVALVQAAGRSLEDDHFVGYGNTIADAIAQQRSEAGEVDDELVGHAIDWLDAHEAGPSARDALFQDGPEAIRGEVLAHLEHCQNTLDKTTIERALRHTPETLIGEQITTRNLESTRATVEELYNSICSVPVGAEIPPAMLDAAVVLIEGKFGRRNKVRKIKVRKPKSDRFNKARLRKAAQRAANKARRVVRTVKQGARKQARALKQTRKRLRQQANRVTSTGGGSLFDNSGATGGRRSFFRRGGGTTYQAPPNTTPTLLVLPGARPTTVVTNVTRPGTETRQSVVTAEVARQLVEAKTALGLATTDEQRRIAQAQVTLLEKQMDKLMALNV